jgi:hypothetical protein
MNAIGDEIRLDMTGNTRGEMTSCIELRRGFSTDNADLGINLDKMLAQQKNWRDFSGDRRAG